MAALLKTVRVEPGPDRISLTLYPLWRHISIIKADQIFSYVNLDINNPLHRMFYLEKGQSSSGLIINCINEMLKSKFHNCIFYTHNFGGYDVVFLLKILLEFNKKNHGFYKLKMVLRDNKIVKLEVSASISKSVKNKIIFVDSLNLLPDSLDNLGKKFSTRYKKSFFPHDFITDKTLYYIGSTPSIEYYLSVKQNMKVGDYKVLLTDKFYVKQETLKYLTNDLISLLQIIYQFSKYIFELFDIQVTSCLTVTGLALNIFLTNYLNDSKLPLINNKSIYYDLKRSYYGGLSEVYKPYGENLYYYDVNSLFPYVALMDMPGINSVYIEDYSERGLDLDNLFGFFYCKIKTTHDYLGLLSLRVNGRLTQPNGEFEGWYWSPILQFAKSEGYEIKVIKGYSFNKVENVFTSYITKLYEIKSNNSGPLKSIAKYLLNSLIGRFGMHLEKRRTKLMTHDNYLKVLMTQDVYDEKWITDQDVLLTYSSDINKSLCESFSVDYIDTLNKTNTDTEYTHTVKNISVVLSSAITSYSNIYMYKIKLLTLKQGGNLYYTDIDSIVTDIKLPGNLIGSEIGKFKLEYNNIKRGYFISSKTYCLVLNEKDEQGKNKVVIKSKGVTNSNLTEQDFINSYEGKQIKAVKSQSKKNLEEGYVSITNKDVKVNPRRL